MKEENLPESDARTPSVEVAKVEITSTTPIKIALVDDDQHFSEALGFQLSTSGFQVTRFPSAESFLESSGFEGYECVVADVCLPGINGLQLLAETRRRASFLSVVFITGSGDIAIGVQAMREGAVDCLEKPIEEAALLKAIGRATDLYRMKRAQKHQHTELRLREGRLTPREREVFGLIARGLLNKQVGAMLGATERTIKTHRGRVMDKMCAASFADLVRMADILQTQTAFSRNG